MWPTDEWQWRRLKTMLNNYTDRAQGDQNILFDVKAAGTDSNFSCV